MLEQVRAGYDVVYGQRIKRHGETAFKRGTAALFYRMLSALVDTPIPRDTGDFRLMTRRVVDQLNAMPERYRFIRGLVSYVGFNQTAFPYERDPRFAGETNYPLRKMLALAVDAVTSFSVVPLRFASHLGMLFGIAGLAALVWVAWGWLRGGTVEGWASLAAVTLIMGSVQLLVLGVFGEYLGRMYMEAKQRPLFIVSEVRRHPAAANEEPETAASALQADEGIRVAG
jgi:dolichol-phosphate mannosyltransferase